MATVADAAAPGCRRRSPTPVADGAATGLASRPPSSRTVADYRRVPWPRPGPRGTRSASSPPWARSTPATARSSSGRPASAMSSSSPSSSTRPSSATPPTSPTTRAPSTPTSTVASAAGASFVFAPVGRGDVPGRAAVGPDPARCRRAEPASSRASRVPGTSTGWPPWCPGCWRPPAPAGPTSARRTSSSWPWCAASSPISICRSRWWVAPRSGTPTDWPSPAETCACRRRSAGRRWRLPRALRAGRRGGRPGRRRRWRRGDSGHGGGGPTPSRWSISTTPPSCRPTPSSRSARWDGRVPLRLLIAASVGPVRLIDNLDPRRPLPSAPAAGSEPVR